MSDFFVANCVGTGDMSGAMTTGAMSAPAADLDDFRFIQSGGNSALAALLRDGAGNVQLDNVIAGTGVVVLDLGAAPTANYYIEVVYRSTPTTDYSYLGLFARCSPMTVNDWGDGVNCLGVEFDLTQTDVLAWRNNDSSNGSNDSGGVFSADSGSIYGAGPYTFTLRLQVEGAVRTVLVNGVVVYTGAIPADANYVAGGHAYVAFNFDTGYTGSLFDSSIRSLKAGSLTPGVFWHDYEKSFEVDA